MNHLIAILLLTYSQCIRFKFKVNPGEMQCFTDELTASTLLVGEASATSTGY